eukprot:1493360-Pyramimonas_sp.AAC.1
MPGPRGVEPPGHRGIGVHWQMARVWATIAICLVKRRSQRPRKGTRGSKLRGRGVDSIVGPSALASKPRRLRARNQVATTPLTTRRRRRRRW